MEVEKMIEKGIYRHFRGEHYLVKGLAKDCGKDEVYVIYANVKALDCNFIRKLSEFFDIKDEEGLIEDRIDNPTRQRKRFQLISL